MSTTTATTTSTTGAATAAPSTPSTEPTGAALKSLDLGRISTRFGLWFPIAQITLMIGFSIFILPKGGSPDGPALERGINVLAAKGLYSGGNYLLMLSGMLFLGFLGAVALRLRKADSTGVLATVAVASGTLIALIWPMAAMLHDTFLEVGKAGADPRILGGADAVAPYSLAFSVFPRIAFMAAVIVALRVSERTTFLRRAGVVAIVLSLIGSLVLINGSFMPVLALGSLLFELWVGAVAWFWLRKEKV